MIWLNMDLFYWRFFLTMFLYLQDMMTWTLLHFIFTYWLDISSRMFWNIVGYFLPILRIKKIVVLFLASKALFHGLLLVDWEIYDILFCSKYCDTIQIWLSLGGKITRTSNISYLMKGWSESSIFNYGRVEIFLPIMSSEPCYHPLPNLLLRSSNI